MYDPTGPPSDGRIDESGLQGEREKDAVSLAEKLLGTGEFGDRAGVHHEHARAVHDCVKPKRRVKAQSAQAYEKGG